MIRVINACFCNKSQRFNIVKFISHSFMSQSGTGGTALLSRFPPTDDSGIQVTSTLLCCHLKCRASEVTMEGKIKRDDQPGVLWPGLEVMYTTSARGSEPSRAGSTRLQGPLEHVVVLCAHEEEMKW